MYKVLIVEDAEQLPETEEEFTNNKEKYDYLDHVAIMVHHAKMRKQYGDKASDYYYGSELQSKGFKQWDCASEDNELKRLLGNKPKGNQNSRSQ